MVRLKVLCLIDSVWDEDEIGYVGCGEGIRHVFSSTVCSVSKSPKTEHVKLGLVAWQYSAPARGRAKVVQSNIEIRTTHSTYPTSRDVSHPPCLSRSRKRVSKPVLPSSSFRLLHSCPQTSPSYQRPPYSLRLVSRGNDVVIIL